MTSTAVTERRGLAAVGSILADIRFEQTLFSLPFLLLSAFVAAGGPPAARVLGWILVALVAARSAAMAANRSADALIDARNPRTAERAVPAGRVSRAFMAVFAAVAAAVFVLAAAQLNPLCLALSPVALLFLIGYSWTKRVTALCHLFLGAAIGIAPLGAWAAVRGTFANASGAVDWTPWLLGGAVAAWVAGFDVIYACPDADRDAADGLHSIPARLGASGAFRVAALLHVAALGLFAGGGILGGLGPVFWVAAAVGAGILVLEHRLVGPGRYERMGLAFFRLNALFSVLLAGAGIVDVLRSA